jgi:PAS domain S-box-containing protein
MGLHENCTILLVEDEAIIALSETKTLERYGFQVRCVYSGEEAVSQVERASTISLILMDINLGGGIDDTQAARIILKKREIPIIFLFSHTERDIMEKTDGITSFGYIVKNSGETVLIASIKMAFRLLESRMKERELEEFRTRVFEDSKIPIVVMDAGTHRIVDCNPAAVSIYGYGTKDEVLGKMPVDLSVPFQYDGVSSQEKAQWYIDTAMRDSLVVFEWTHRRPSGETWDAEVHLMTFRSNNRDFLQLTIQDISARKRAERALLESNRMMSTLLSNLPGMAYRCENVQDWRMLFVSEGCAALTGHQAEDIKANRPAYGDLIVDEDRDGVWTAIQAAMLRREPFEINYRIKTADAVTKWVWERGRGIFDAEGRFLFIEGFIMDITERRLPPPYRQNASVE